ncbi:hypothetical protein PPERSA_05491 [Pseudocohnilembus persalinus]|uniref:Lanthionine synthetase C-like protein n=1 Tax=Pseudocohnilembus persalinus TaxID=266149 RepID=A0A0V0QD42_PSEPJ|nr:hypothetical protein PPERSA_05491 [Pseudocohnilembus persalinus]|eukprot:KRW99988.1 hypothetical protein PPERSA_05491 [Pseudocohnilembus persalinus]
MQYKDAKFIQNNLQDFQEEVFDTDIQNKLQLQIIKQIEIDTDKFFAVISPHQPVAIASNAKYSSIQYDLFEGAGGYLYYYLKFYDFLEKFDPQQFIQQNHKRLYFLFCGVEYLGAAHGTLGIIYMLLKGYQINQQLIDNKEAQFSRVLKEKIKETVNFILEFQNEEGNFPPSSKFQPQNENSLVQFCHGAPGAISALLECFKVYQKNEYLQAALKSGEQRVRFMSWD